MDKMLEIRWHGRGGQGVKTASLLLAEAAFVAGKSIQGFPEYGPERMGAPVTAYNRISDNPITIHSNIYEPDLVAVADATLIGTVDVTAGLKKENPIIVNTDEDPKVIKEKLGFEGPVYTVDANSISVEALGKVFPNVPMMAAVVKVSGLMSYEEFYSLMEKQFQKKFATKQNVIAGNLKALEKAFKEVKSSEEV